MQPNNLALHVLWVKGNENQIQKKESLITEYDQHTAMHFKTPFQALDAMQ